MTQEMIKDQSEKKQTKQLRIQRKIKIGKVRKEEEVIKEKQIQK